jgi:adenylate cyclase
MRSPLLKGVLLGLLIGVLGLLVSPLRFALDMEEDTGLGLLFKLRGERQAPSDAVVVSIDKESSERLGVPDNPDKWPRSLHARLTETLAEAGAQVIAFDVHFIEPRVPEDDELFARAMGRAGNVVLTEPLKTKEVPGAGGSGAPDHNIVRIIPPIDLFARAARATAPFTLPRIPFKVSQYWTFETAAGDSPTVPAIVLQLYAMKTYGQFVRMLEKASPGHAGVLPPHADPALTAKGVKEVMKDIRAIFESEPSTAERMFAELGALSVDAEERRLLSALIEMYAGGNSRYINYFGPPGTVTTVPYYRALGEGEDGGPGVDLSGKAVFVGLSEVLLAERKDSFYTVFSQANGTFISGVEIAATAFSNLLVDTPVRPLSTRNHLLFVLLWGIVMGVLCRAGPVWLGAAAAVGLSVLYLLGALHQFTANHVWYPLVVPLFLQAPLAFFGAVLWNYIDTNKERKNIKKAFEHYLPKDVVAQLAKDLVHIRTGNRVVYGICLFTDAEQYTSFSETMDPAELGRFMNRYYETMFRPVKKHGGIVSGVIGDAMLALWVAAASEAALKEKACLAALDINRELQLFNESSEEVKLKTCIGLHCGQILLGHVGALDHYEYTPMGDIVNAASRVEGLNKYLGTTVLVSDEVMEGQEVFLSRELGNFRVKGKIKPIGLYELRGRREDAGEAERRLCEVFAEGLAAFRTRSWDEAAEKFLHCSEILGEDGPSLFYLGLCEDYRENPPEEAWAGVVHMEKK